jgi:hypothetical protein
MSRLEDSIERLYAAFADVPKPRQIDGCPCCFTEAEIAVLLARDRRVITPKELSSYASSALATIGSVSDYLYFLPRILEITATDDSWWPDPEITAGRIIETEPAKWPARRVDALEDFLGAVVRSLLAPDRHQLIDSWICAIAIMGFDVKPHLKSIDRSTDAVLAYFNDNSADLPRRRLRNSFGAPPCEGHDVIVDWFYSKKIRDIVFDAYGYVMPEKN